MRAVVMAMAGMSLGAAPPKDMKVFWNMTCAACHGSDGSGRAATGQRLPGKPLNDPRWLALVKEEDLVKVILRGRAAMPGYKGLLSEEEARRMVTDVLRPLTQKRK